MMVDWLTAHGGASSVGTYALTVGVEKRLRHAIIFNSEAQKRLHLNTKLQQAGKTQPHTSNAKRYRNTINETKKKTEHKIINSLLVQVWGGTFQEVFKQKRSPHMSWKAVGSNPGATKKIFLIRSPLQRAWTIIWPYKLFIKNLRDVVSCVYSEDVKYAWI